MDIRREELLKLIRGGLTPKALEEQLSNYHENDIAGILEELEQPAVSYTHLRAHETGRNLVCRLLLEKKKKQTS